MEVLTHPRHLALVLVSAPLAAHPIVDLTAAVLPVILPPPGHIPQPRLPIAVRRVHLAALDQLLLVITERGESVHCRYTLYHSRTEARAEKIL